MDYRLERDTIGEIKVASDKYWGGHKHSVARKTSQLATKKCHLK